MTGEPTYYGSHEGQYVAWRRLAVDVHLETITSQGKLDEFVQVVEAVLDVDVLTAPPPPALIEIEHLTYVSSPANFLDQQLSLHRPAAKRWRIVADLQNSCSRIPFGNAIRIALGGSIHEKQPSTASRCALNQPLRSGGFLG